VEFDFTALPQRLFGPDARRPGVLAARWLFLRALGLIFFSAFYSLLFQIRGLIGPQGLLPAQPYLAEVARVLGGARFWYVPSVLWWSASDRMLLALCFAGMAASLLLVLNIFPRGMLFVCLIAFLSFISAAQDFSSYQSDGMLLEAGFISLFFAPEGWHPGWGAADPPSRASRYLLLWLWFRIYFESGVVKILSGDPEWRNFTAMDEYYQNGPLPTWIGWYAQHLPHWFHAAAAFLTLALELVLIFGAFLPRPARIVLFFIVTPWQMAIILTSNYAFLNYLVLALAVLLLDDRFLSRMLPQELLSADAPSSLATAGTFAPAGGWRYNLRLGIQGFFLTWIFYVTSVLLVGMLVPQPLLPVSPVRALEPFRIANQFGLFAVMTRGRYEIEFQGSRDGQNWTPYPFRYKPQDLREAPRIYAPYQPRFDWNLWFASLNGWRENLFVFQTEKKLLSGEPNVLQLFAGDPFQGQPPKQIRAILWQYWFTSWKDQREQGLWWRREEVGLYAPTIERTPDGKLVVLEWPGTPASPSNQ